MSAASISMSGCRTSPGVSCLLPEGAFYIFMNIKELLGKTIKGVKINNSTDFASAFLEKGLVAVVPWHCLWC